MTQEIQQQIIDQFWGIVPTLLLFMLGGAILGVGVNIINKKVTNKIKKMKQEQENKKSPENRATKR